MAKRKTTPAKTYGVKPSQFRFDEALLAKVAAIAEHHTAPGLPTLGRADAIRIAVAAEYERITTKGERK